MAYRSPNKLLSIDWYRFHIDRLEAKLPTRERFSCLIGGAILALLFTVSSCIAQTTFGSIVGTLTDSTGGVIPGVQVRLTNLDTSETRTATADADGLYQFVNILPGNYRLEAEKAGFKRVVRAPIQVEVQNTVRINLILPVGEATETVQVTAEQTPLLQPESSSLGQVIGQRSVTELPLNGRNAMNLVALAPSVVPQGQTQGTVTAQNQYSYGNYQMGGGMANQSAVFLDGQPLNLAYQNIVGVIPTQDSVQEFKVQTNNLPPEFGRYAGGVVNFSTKSGTNQFHGGAWEFLRNKVFNSNNYFSNQAGLPNPPFTQNQFGVNIGGPVSIPHVYNGQNKTLFFFSYEGFRLREGGTFVSTVPTPAQRAGDFSSTYLGPGVPDNIYDATTSTPDPSNPGQYTRQQFPGNIIPASRFSPAALQLIKLYPLPNTTGVPTTGANNWAGDASIGGNNNEYVARIDQNVSAKQHLFGRYT
jgi:Carboxypeptidase regulatory-like domain